MSLGSWRPDRGQPVLPAHQSPLSAAHDPDSQSFGSWGEVFGDRIIATAILDRILHHAITLNIRGNSYRLKDKLKAGLVRPTEASQ